MADTCLISIEGVLSKDGPPNGQPDMTALRLFHGIQHMFKVVLSTTCDDVDWITHWMEVVGITDTNFLRREFEGETYDIRMANYATAVRLGYDVRLVVDADPSVCAEVMRRGVVSLLWAHPRYARPEARPDYVERHQARRTWDEITDEIDRTKTLGVKIPIDADMRHE